MLRTIDVSSNQGNINIAPIDCDVVIAKATGGNNYVNDCCDFVIQQCIKLSKPFGFYHYAHEYGQVSTPETEAHFFIENSRNYFTHGIAILDYEVAINGRNYTQEDVKWVKQFIDYVYNNTGVYCLLYISKSLLNAGDWSEVAKVSGLWFAQYADNKPTGWIDAPWTDNKPLTPFIGVMHQYTSTGVISGYNGVLDLSIFYGDLTTWKAYADPQHSVTHEPTEKPIDYLTPFAKDVIKGVYGTGQQRKDNIYNAIQNKVNELIK